MFCSLRIASRVFCILACRAAITCLVLTLPSPPSTSSVPVSLPLSSWRHSNARSRDVVRVHRHHSGVCNNNSNNRDDDDRNKKRANRRCKLCNVPIMSHSHNQRRNNNIDKKFNDDRKNMDMRTTSIIKITQTATAIRTTKQQQRQIQTTDFCMSIITN